MEVPEGVLWGIHTARAAESFTVAGRPVHAALVRAYGDVKLACATTNRALGYLEGRKADALEEACREMAAGLLTGAVVVDALQGGAGTSTNMNVNEVLANRALEILGEARGRYDLVSPLDDVNRHQSTNDTYPTALKLAAIRLLRAVERAVLGLQEAFQAKERELAHVVKVGRTEMQDAVLTTVGRSMGAFAEAFNRDRWRISRCEERLRVVNLGGTAIGTGLGAPRAFIFGVVDRLRERTGIGFARAENLVDATQNADVFVEVSGTLKACAASLLKVSGDLRLLSSGPEAGLGELRLPPRQAGSSIMPGKVNPVIPEVVNQVAFQVIGNDLTITLASEAGQLQLNVMEPILAFNLFQSVDMLTAVIDTLRLRCIRGITANRDHCREMVDRSIGIVTAVVPALGYERASEVAKEALATGRAVRDLILEKGYLSAAQLDDLLSIEAMTKPRPLALGDRTV